SDARAAMRRDVAGSFTDYDTDARARSEAVTQALARGLLEISHVDHAVVRQLVARARTGEFDTLPRGPAERGAGTAPSDGAAGPSASDEAAAQPSPSDPDHPRRAERRALSREVAVRSAVLLARSDATALPLRPGPLTVL